MRTPCVYFLLSKLEEVMQKGNFANAVQALSLSWGIYALS